MEGSKDDLKWFGEGFDGFPKRLPEDCVEYMLFIIDSGLTQKEVLTRLETVRKEALKLTARLLKDYIWQREDFNLKLKQVNDMIYLHGLTNYGDSVEDEWLIVYILRELTKQFPDLWIKVVDTDGEFLLIEAANALPRWLNPEIADNRVWINNNKLRIVPLSTDSSPPTSSKTAPVSRSLTLPEAQATISKTPDILINSPAMESEAFYRLRNYPGQISDSLHSALVTIPRKLAYIIHNCPASIAPAVEAFYLRDPIGLKPLQTPSSTLEFPPVDLVTTSIKFTKVLFAQVKSQHFEAPIAWKSVLADIEKSIQADPAKAKYLTRAEIGMKVTSGYEMLMQDGITRDHRAVREMQILLDDLKDGEKLPTDAEMEGWVNSKKEDDESWLDINFEDFEKELQGKGGGTKADGPEGAFSPPQPSGFGDAKTQSDLKKMVERFESFLSDDKAGVDGADLDDMDFDDDDDDDESGEEIESEDEDREVKFDEKEFARLMREMMGMPPEEEQARKSNSKKDASMAGKVEELDTDDEEEDEAEELRKVMERMDAELKESGVLNLDPTPSKLSALKSGKPKDEKGKSLLEKQDWESDSDEEVNIDFNLAKNLLESFKSQAGMAGPGGNLLGMMGMQLPRDEDDSEPSERQ